jgi:hypothetical protein
MEKSVVRPDQMDNGTDHTFLDTSDDRSLFWGAADYDTGLGHVCLKKLDRHLVLSMALAPKRCTGPNIEGKRLCTTSHRHRFKQRDIADL